MQYKKLSYQTKAINQLLDATSEFFEYDDQDQTFVFQAPTGSGKTFILSKYMESLINEIEEQDFCFLWISVGAGKLQEQSYRAVCDYTRSFLKCSLLENICFGSKAFINKGEVVFINWEKINNKDKQTQEWTNSLMKDREQINLPSLLENTRNQGRKIILIIDESHTSSTTETAIRIKNEIIKPTLTIESSATPILKEYDRRIIIDIKDVINEGMVKEEVLINPGICDIDRVDELESKEVILQAAFDKQRELLDLYRREESKIKPLVLIQIPNGDEGIDNIEYIKDFLYKKNISETNGKLAIWLSDMKSETLDTINKIESPVEYLIFKQAIATGWDCPRAQILVRFREVKSIIFDIQTVGRILRSPEAKKYNNHELNTAYVYTNIQQIEIKKEKTNLNIIKSLNSIRKKEYQSINLISYYHSRQGSYNDVDSKYYSFFEKEFKEHFDIDTSDTMFNEIINQLAKKGVDIYSVLPKEEVLSNVSIETSQIPKEDQTYEGSNILLNLSAIDLQNRYNNLIKNNLNGLAYIRSLSTVKMAIAKTFQKYLGINPYEPNNIIKIQKIVLTYEKHFTIILDKSIKEYKLSRENNNSDKQDKVIENWEIPEFKMYNPNVYKEIKSELSLHQPLYMLINVNGKVDGLEEKFIKYLGSKTDHILWFWHNGQEHMEQNFGIKYNKGLTFQPDFIIKFKNGKIGIFDTKPVSNNFFDTKTKAEALQSYIKECDRTDLFGGIVVNQNEQYNDKQPIFMLNTKDIYESLKDAPKEWKMFEELFMD